MLSKKILLRLFCVLASYQLFNVTFAQPSNFYFQNNPVWQVRDMQYGSNLPCAHIFVNEFSVSNDSTVNGKVYKKLLEKTQDLGYQLVGQPPYIPYYCTGPILPYTGVPSLKCLIRSQNKQMYVLPNGTSTEYLLYDFNLQIGSTLPQTPINNGTITVSSIDSILTPNGYRKRFLLNSANNPSQYLIEGIGHSKGFIDETMEGQLSHISWLECYKQSSSPWINISGNACIALSVKAPESFIASTKVAPNPFTYETTFRFSTDIEDGVLYVYSSTGKLCGTYPKIHGDSYVFQRQQLPCGLYFFELKDKQTTLEHGRFIIHD
ncbi:MAG: hypothetical protein QM534_17105 [Sediminibacterium sp.]|nr:hypothetical protein [Sediminibacterium sp.]